MDDEQWLDRASVPTLTFVDSHREAQSVGLLFAAWPDERARDQLTIFNSGGYWAQDS